MLKFISLFILLFISFNSHSYNRVFTPINNAKIVHGQGATVRNLIGAGNTLAGRTRVAAAVTTTGGKFAVATINPRSALGFGIQFAKGNPYTLAAMAASIYFQDEIGEWFQPGTETGENPDFKIPELKQVWSATCGASSHSIPISGDGDLPLSQSLVETCGPKLAPLFEANAPEHLCRGDIVCTATFSEGSILFKREIDGIVLSRSSSPVVVFNTLEEESLQCPPADFLSYDMPSVNGDGVLDKCFNPATANKYLPVPVSPDNMIPEYADDLMEWHNTSIDALQDWSPDPAAPHHPQLTPYVDSATGNIEPEYISSYNEPDVSPLFNQYMTWVNSGVAQTTDPSAPHFVPSDLIQPTEAAITATFNDAPFVDPTTGTVTEPATSTDGSASTSPTPTGTVDNPINVTGNITVNVEIPEDDTISQTEYEQSNAKFFDQFNTQAQLEQTKMDTKLEDLKTQDSDFIDSLTPDITNFAVPDFPTLASIWPSFSTGNCIALVLPASVGGLQQTITFDAHCPPYNTYIHPLLVWLLYMATGLYVFHLAHETLGRK